MNPETCERGVKRQRWLSVLPRIILVLSLWWQSDFVLAQEWATSGVNIYNTNNGNVGIGTTNPAYKLTISGGNIGMDNDMFLGWKDAGGTYRSTLWLDTANNLNLGNNSGVSDIRLHVSDSANAMVIKAGGNVGIGTTNPSRKLHIYSTDINSFSTMDIETTQSSQGSQVRLVTPGGDYSLSLQRYGTFASGNYPHLGGTVAYSNSANLFASLADNFLIGTHGSLHFTTGGTSYYRMVILYNGNVGIGTESPQEQLHVTGNIRVDGNIAAKYQDVAEWVPSSHPISAGTVVILDSQNANKVISSSQPYDTRVAGVVTDSPGILLGEGGRDKVKVATTGRVKVKVDATYEPIHVGDLLVTSEKEGYAMRSKPVDLGGIPIHRPGTLIGKALEPLGMGEGEILVLLSLQ